MRRLLCAHVVDGAAGTGCGRTSNHTSGCPVVALVHVLTESNMCKGPPWALLSDTFAMDGQHCGCSRLQRKRQHPGTAAHSRVQLHVQVGIEAGLVLAFQQPLQLRDTFLQAASSPHIQRGHLTRKALCEHPRWPASLQDARLHVHDIDCLLLASILFHPSSSSIGFRSMSCCVSWYPWQACRQSRQPRQLLRDRTATSITPLLPCRTSLASTVTHLRSSKAKCKFRTSLLVCEQPGPMPRTARSMHDKTSNSVRGHACTATCRRGVLPGLA